MKAYRIHGKMRVGTKLMHWQPFTWEVVAKDEDDAIERVYSEVGSKHGVKRNLIEIEKIEAITLEVATNPRVIYALQQQKKK